MKQNVNDIENMTVVAFQFGPLNLSFKTIKNELIKKWEATGLLDNLKPMNENNAFLKFLKQ